MSFELPALPYAKDALAPHISAEPLEYHDGKHHFAFLYLQIDIAQHLNVIKLLGDVFDTDRRILRHG